MQPSQAVSKKLCANLQEHETLFTLSTPEGKLGGYKIINNAPSVDVAHTSWFTADGSPVATVSPTKRISQEGMDAIQTLEATYSKKEPVVCAGK